MRQLFINDKPAVIKENTMFTLIRENPFFTDAGDYTYDVTLPLSGCIQNLRIFGPIHRYEVDKSQLVDKKFRFRLEAPLLSISGIAIIIDINRIEVKLQLLAGTSSFNCEQYDDKWQNIYIDELDLGKAYEDKFPEAYENGDRFYNEGSHRTISPRAVLMTKLHNNSDDTILFGNHSETHCVNFPIYSIADEEKSNDHALFRRDREGVTRLIYRFPTFTPSFAYRDENKYMMAAQPYLVDIVESVIQQIGYSVVSNDIIGTWMEDIFIANCKSEYKFNRILPHWTVAEFFKEIRQFYGVFFAVRDKSVSIVCKSAYYQNPKNLIEIHQVIDDYSTRLEGDSEAKDMSYSNVDYAQPSMDDMLRLPDEVWQNAIIKHYANEQLMIWGESQVPQNKKNESTCLIVVDDTKKVYAYLKSKDPKGNGAVYLAQVDCCPPLIRHGEQFGPGHRDTDISLKIVPAVMRWINVNYATADYSTDMPKQTMYENAIAMPMICSSFSRDNNLDHYSVDAAVNPDTEQTNDEKDVDVIEVAYNAGLNVVENLNYNEALNRWQAKFPAGGQTIEEHIPIALGIAYVQQKDGFYIPVTCPSNTDQFNMLNRNTVGINISALTQGFEIDTRCKHIISFLDNIELDPTKVFLINNKKYACEKIEYNINDQGVMQVKKGTFYEIREHL